MCASKWKHRFENFENAIKLLNEVVELDFNNLSMLEKEGVVQRFEYTLELAWKTLKDKMEDDGLVLEFISPKVVLKQAYQSKYIDNIELWLQMINDRNLLSHIYNYETVIKIIQDIQNYYINLLNDLYNRLKNSF